MYNIEAELYLRYKNLMPLSSQKRLESALKNDFKSIYGIANSFNLVNADSLIEKYDAFFFDAFGTLFNRNGYVYPGALEFFKKIKSAKKEIRMVTNAATNSAAKVALDMAAMGFDILPRHIYSSGKDVLLYKEKYGFDSVYYAGRPGGVRMLQEFGIEALENPSTPVVAFCSTEPDIKRLEKAEHILSKPNALLLILNPDACAPELNGTRSEVSGIQSYRILKKTNCKFEISGKPFLESFADALNSLKSNNERVLMIGDTLGTDVMGAYVAGIDSCLVLGRNVTSEAFEKDCLTLQIRPTWVVPGFT